VVVYGRLEIRSSSLQRRVGKPKNQIYLIICTVSQKKLNDECFTHVD
jgi:hypothetical protein